jgi:hypothetical protein
MGRNVLDVLLAMPEQNRFIRGMVSWAGFRQVAIPYERAAREKGVTKYTPWKMLDFALDAITGFSAFPLRLSIAFSLIFFLVSIATHGRQVVAIDTGNAVFLSKDGGKRWKAVSVQWTGRAVKADLVSYGIAPIPAMGAVTAGLAASYSAPNPSPAPIEAASPAASSLSGSSLTGTVTDKTGASIPGATVLVTDSVGHLARTAYTDRDGRYRVDGLSPGAYGVKVQAVGFNTQVLPFVTVVAAQQSVANVSLDVGAATQTVTVEASADAISAPGRAKKSLTKSPSAGPAAPVFEITTDNGDRWTSADGVAWKKK